MPTQTETQDKMRLNFSSELAASEALVNCFLRESGREFEVREGQLLLELRYSNRSLVIPVSERMKLGDVRLAGLPDVRAIELAELLAREIQGDHPHHPDRKPDWKENFESSLSIIERILTFRKSISPSEEISDFIASEQSLNLGHRFHPSAKSRIGFSNEDLLRYSPEMGAKFQLHYFSMPREGSFVFAEEGELSSWMKRARAFLNVPENHIVIPAHPWQAKHVLKDSKFVSAIQSGEVLDLGVCGPEFYPTASVRTLYQPEWDLFLKTSLDVRITNCFRPNLKSEMESAFKVSQVLNSSDFETNSFRIMCERLCLDVGDQFDVHLGVIFRDGFKRAGVQADSQTLLAASLFGDRHFSTERLRALIGDSTEEVLAWFQSYCRLLLSPLMKCFWTDGLMLEAHLQNVLVEFEGGKPVRILQRDLDNAKIVRGGSIDQRVSVSTENAFFDLETAWSRFTYCLFVNHLSEAISSLAHLDAENVAKFEDQLWLVLKAVLNEEQIPVQARERLFKDEHLWAKKNFFTRVVRGDDLKAPFAFLPNPLVDKAQA